MAAARYVLWVPPTHVLVSGRLVLWLAVGAPALREAYEWLERRDSAAAAVTATKAAAAAAAAGELAAERTGLPCGGVRVHAKTPAPPPSFDKLGAFAWLAIAVRDGD
jgi:Phosphatidyl serine synthase